jgi:L-lactate dehydrogenase complex protein LldF
MSIQETFMAKSGVKAADMDHRHKINYNIAKYNAAVKNGMQQYTHLTDVRKKAKLLKWQAIEQLDKNLELFEKNFTANGGKVIWAQNAQEALNEILAICKKTNCKTVVKSKSMVTEEIHLNDFLEKHNIESIESDLGEYIQQLDGEPPYHIVTPAMHKSKEDVARLFANKLGTEPNLTPEQLTQVARHMLRKKYVEAEVGITGANFILPDSGSIAITENEGNGRLSCGYPKIHIAITGIEKVLTGINDLQLFWPLLATYGTGQQLTVYNSIISGPQKAGEGHGPHEMYVILLDNGRTNVLHDATARESLYCIRCGSCLNACPVYKNIGGHSYGTTYSGPIGKVITPHLQGMNDYKHLSYSSSLCGNCTEACPIKINLHELLLHNRHEAVSQGNSTLTERIAWKVWQKASLSRTMMNMGNGKLKNWVVNKVFKGWTTHRSDLNFSGKTFNQLWKERAKDN